MIAQTEKYDYRVVWSEEDEAFLARVAEFPSLAAHGDSTLEALNEIQEVVRLVILDLKEEGESVPQPFSSRQYSGKLNLRLPRTLHRELAKEAVVENVSLNQLIVTKLASRSRVA